MEAHRSIEGFSLEARSYLVSDTQVSQDPGGSASVVVTVRNGAPTGPDAPEIVFVGVGLTLADRRGAQRPRWGEAMRRERPSDRPRTTNDTRGSWYGGGERLSEITPAERSSGDVLCPGESIVYQLSIPTDELPFARIAVEGTLSHHHLFHVVVPVEGLEGYAKPGVAEWLRKLNALDIHEPLHTAAYTMPDFGPGTTAAQMEEFRELLQQTLGEIDGLARALIEVYRAAPTVRAQAHLKDVVGRYVSRTKRLIEGLLKAAISGDLRQMEASASELVEQSIEAERVNRVTEELMASYGITAEEAGYRFGA